MDTTITLAINKNITSARKLQGKFFNIFIKLQVGQIPGDRIGEVDNSHSGLKYLDTSIEYSIRKIRE